MSGVDFVLGIQLLQYLGMVGINFNDIFMLLSSKGNKIEIS